MSSKKSSRPTDRSVPRTAIKRMLKHGAPSDLRVSKASVNKAHSFALQLLGTVSEHLRDFVTNAKRQTIMKNDVIVVFTKSLPCGVRVSATDLEDSNILKVRKSVKPRSGMAKKKTDAKVSTSVKTFTASAIGKIVKDKTRLRMSAPAKKMVAIGLAKVIAKLGRVSGTQVRSRMTENKSSGTILERDVVNACQLIENSF